MITAIVLAAGLSKRMGRPKMILPWGDTTVIGHVVKVLSFSGIDDIIVVTGGARKQVETALQGLPARQVFNTRYRQDEMAYSLQVGLSNLPDDVEAALVVLGDQPQIEAAVVKTLLYTYQETRAPLVIPSYQMRRGHPWVIARPLWGEIMSLQPPQTMRDMLNSHSALIHYLPVDTATILHDLDTPSDYEREHVISSDRRMS